MESREGSGIRDRGSERKGGDLGDEADAGFGVVGVVGVGANGAALVLLDEVLVDDLFEGAAVAEAVVEDLRRDGRKEIRIGPTGLDKLRRRSHCLLGKWKGTQRLDVLKRLRGLSAELFQIRDDRGFLRRCA